LWLKSGLGTVHLFELRVIEARDHLTRYSSSKFVNAQAFSFVDLLISPPSPDRKSTSTANFQNDVDSR